MGVNQRRGSNLTHHSPASKNIKGERKGILHLLGTLLKDRIRLHFEKDKGQILDLVLQYETLINKKWVVIVRYDCAHGFFYRDLLHPNGDKEKKVIDIPDLKYGISFAKQDLEDKWEWYKEQYLKKLKNEK